MCEWSNIPISVPTAIVTAKPIPNAAIFGCADIAFSSFCFIDILLAAKDYTIKGFVISSQYLSKRKISIAY